MSGIVGMINLDGAPINRELLRRMVESMTCRGPDAQDIWIDGHVGFGHTMLRTTFESQTEKQPCSLDGQVWITADGRIDAREGLIRELTRHGCAVRQDASDPELILHAYHVWGEDCVQHLLGDFAVAIWDGRRQRLICARDHFGVRLFYYARVVNCFLFSNTLNCLRLHPAITNDLNDTAIGDFLLFGCNYELPTTTFADIQRLPPAHFLTYAEGSLQIQRYWNFPLDGHIIRYNSPDDYVDHFKQLLDNAVRDRLRTDSLGIWMSGGLDSTTLAACACRARQDSPAPLHIEAHCGIYESLIDDHERYYADLAAKALGVPIHYLVMDQYQLFERWDEPLLRRPEPVDDPLLAGWVGFLERMTRSTRVAFYGEDGDALLSTGTVADMLRGIGLREVSVAVLRYMLTHRQRPPLGLGLYTRLRRWSQQRTQPPYPTWLNPDFEARIDLKGRWVQKAQIVPNPLHPTHPGTHQRLMHPVWQSFLEGLDAGVTGFPVEVRLPLLDLRLVDYILAIPPLPWCVNKELIRQAMRASLPEAVLRRPKTPLSGHPYHELLKGPAARWIDYFEPAPRLAQYVGRNAIPHIVEGVSEPEETQVHLRPLSLNYWLQSLESTGLPVVNRCETGIS